MYVKTLKRLSQCVGLTNCLTLTIYTESLEREVHFLFALTLLNAYLSVYKKIYFYAKRRLLKRFSISPHYFLLFFSLI